MKKSLINGLLVNMAFFKLIRIMRLIVFILLTGITQTLAVNSYSQATRLSLDMSNVSVEAVLEKIEDSSEFYFLYNQEKIDVDKTVDVNVTDMRVPEILGLLFEGSDVTYSIVGRQIVLTNEGLKFTESQQQKTITGTVLDDSGQPLPGVTILVKGTTQGTISDINGNYSLPNVLLNATLVFSFVGMVSQEISVGDQTSINVTMLADAIGIEEVVAIGYGTIKKANLTGSISSMSVENIEGKSITQASQALTGQVSGISVRQFTSEPGKDQSNITVRGLGTFSGAGTSPLVLVDGIISDINWVNPNNIKSITVLKDAASAAIYGSRAANGVILIETKQGKKGFEINYNGYFGWQKPIEWPEYLNSWEFAEAKNEAFNNAGLGVAFSQEDIEKYRSGEDPDNYPNIDHYRGIFGSGDGFQTSHNISFSGGSDVSKYLFSVGYLEHNGLVEEFVNRRYSLRLNMSNQVNDRFDLRVKIQGAKNIKENPTGLNSILYTGDLQTDVLVYNAAWFNNTMAARKSDGTYDNLFYASPYAAIDSDNFGKGVRHFMLSNAEVNYEIFKSLTLIGEAAYSYEQTMQKDFYSVVYTGPEKLNIRNSEAYRLTLRALLDYRKNFNGHDIYVLGGFEQEDWRNSYIAGFRSEFPNNELHELSAGDASTQTNDGNGYSVALRSLFGRVQYNFKNKYLFEANIRYDGSSRFPSKNRWGLFPSFSAGWMVSDESFFPETSWMEHLKIRASWGKLGNQEIGNYPYQQTISVGRNYPIGGTITPGARLVTLANSDITWETTTVSNVGFDFSLFKGNLDVTTDIFDKTTDDILYSISVVNMLGLSPSETNAGSVRNRGFEISLNHRGKVGQFHYEIAPNFTYVKNEVTKLATVEQDINKGLFVGEPLGAYYGYVYDGMFLDQADIDSYPTQPYQANPGQLRFKDISGPDGKPDGVVDPTYDRTILGSRIPKNMFGLNLSGNYKGFDISVQLQGESGMQRRLGGLVGYAFWNWGNIQRWQYEGRWDPENPTRYPKYPRLEWIPHQYSTSWESSFWVRDASFLKIKNVQLGYSLPEQWIEKINISSLRVYANAMNLYTFDNYPKGFDPDGIQDDWFWGIHWPLSTTVTFGVDVKF